MLNKHQLFQQWFPLKERKHNTKPNKIQLVSEGDIWWTAVGENVGIEINGKSEYFSRPVLVFKKLSHLGFMGIPMTSQLHDGSWYTKIVFQGREVCASLAQARVFSAARLYNRLGKIDEADMARVKDGFAKLYLS